MSTHYSPGLDSL